MVHGREDMDVNFREGDVITFECSRGFLVGDFTEIQLTCTRDNPGGDLKWIYLDDPSVKGCDIGRTKDGTKYE